MKSLVEAVADSGQRKQIIESTVDLIDQEVARKGGVTGMALKAGYKVVSKMKNGRMIPGAVDKLLDEFAEAIEPLHKQYRESGGSGGFDHFLSGRSSQAADALLSITDQKANGADPLLRKTYEKLRPMAQRHVIEALPGVGRLVDRYTA